jgi:general secretion pathway protein N
MMHRLATAIIVLAASVHGAAALNSVAGVDPQAIDAAEDPHSAGAPAASAIWAPPAAPAQVVVAPAAPAPVPAGAQSANPLWAIPLSALSGTRERPIFSSSRRPPPPAVAPATAPKLIAAPKPREPERPQLSLVGTVASGDEGIGIFLDQSTKAALRLKVGENYQGWKLQSVQGREVILEKDQQGVVLALPQPGAPQPAGAGQMVSDARSGKLLSATLPPRSDRPERR